MLVHDSPSLFEALPGRTGVTLAAIEGEPPLQEKDIRSEVLRTCQSNGRHTHYLIDERKHVCRNVEIDRPGGLEIEDERIPDGQLHRQVAPIVSLSAARLPTRL